MVTQCISTFGKRVKNERYKKSNQHHCIKSASWHHEIAMGQGKIAGMFAQPQIGTGLPRENA